MPIPAQLLVATPALRDPNFARTVVLVLERSDEGALGLVLNRPTGTPVAEALPPWAPGATPPAVVYAGGPVSVTSAVCLARSRPGAEPAGWQPLDGTLGVLDLDSDPAVVLPDLTHLRVFAGYAGWSPGQLDLEVAEGAWLQLGALPGDAFADPPERLWPDVLRRQPGELAFLATFPPDPNLN